MKDFFVSYTETDQAWAVWIAWTLEAAGYSTVIQVWDFLQLSEPNDLLFRRSQLRKSFAT